MKRLLVTRPEPAASMQAARLRDMGFEALIEPLLNIEYLPAPSLQLDGTQGLIVTSANALRALAGAPNPRALFDLPLFTVGEATAELARDQGFCDVRAGPGDAEGLAAFVTAQCAPRNGVMLHLAGERLSFDMKMALAATGHELRTAILYRAVDAEGFSEPARDAIATAQLAGILLMSPATAGVYARLVGSTGLKEPAHGMQYFCLSGAVAERITAIGLRSVNVAATPTEDDLLALVSQRLAS